jgi:hypothetical protein
MVADTALTSPHLANQTLAPAWVIYSVIETGNSVDSIAACLERAVLTTLHVFLPFFLCWTSGEPDSGTVAGGRPAIAMQGWTARLPAIFPIRSSGLLVPIPIDHIRTEICILAPLISSTPPHAM